uniref:Uncharacterized protein n=1 Tax=Chionoecetes opilio bacilliform virus TaxID=1825681 RepID=A0A1Q3DKX0_9VIRU|nr:hypothetical protein SCV_076 [Chionoecetes opilio bacilliform virus]
MVGVWWDTPSVTGTVGTGATTLPNNTIIILSGRAGVYVQGRQESSSIIWSAWWWSTGTLMRSNSIVIFSMIISFNIVVIVYAVERCVLSRTVDIFTVGAGVTR